MVGYEEGDPVSSNQKLWAGVFSGVMTRFITQPIDVIKVRVQLVKKAKKKSMYKIANKIFLEEGILAFYQGHSLGQVHSILSVSSQFYLYELATAYASHHAPKEFNETIVNLMCGACSGCASTTLVIPLEVIRVRQILLHDQYGGFFRGAKQVYQSGGLLAFYEGLGASWLQMGPAIAISFTTFNFVQHLILRQFKRKCQDGKCKPHKPQNVMIATTIAGSVAGFVSKTLTYPFDLAKRRLQIGSHIHDTKYKIPSQVAQLAQCQTLIECFKIAYQKEGLRGLFRGWSVTIYKAQVTSIVAFTTYEMLCYVMRQAY